MKTQSLTPRQQDDLAAWGEMRGFAHVAGYTFEKACRVLEALLEGDRWKLGSRFKTVNEFLDSISLDTLRASAEARKRIANRIRELQPAASNRRIAKAIGVGRRTIDRDTGPNGPPRARNVNPIKGRAETTGPNGPPPVISGAKAAAIIERRTTDIAIVQLRRVEREREFGNKVLALPDAKFGVILADPEWHDETHSKWTGLSRHAIRHYPTSDIETIKARPVADIAADDCVLFLWSTVQHLDVAIDVMRAWGFKYVSSYVWRKPSIGLGFWTRCMHEVLLIGTRGDPPCPANGTQWQSVIDADRGEHSAKPEVFLEMIEQYFPTVPKIELNRRGPPRPGWSAWGNEVVEAEPPAENISKVEGEAAE